CELGQDAQAMPPAPHASSAPPARHLPAESQQPPQVVSSQIGFVGPHDGNTAATQPIHRPITSARAVVITDLAEFQGPATHMPLPPPSDTPAAAPLCKAFASYSSSPALSAARTERSSSVVV